MNPEISARRPGELHKLFESCANDGDIDGLAGLYEESAILVGPAGDHATVSLSPARRGASAEVARRQVDGRWLHVIDDPFREW